uniref:Venom peptide n=1 Tax=Comana monomorpha TaxID=1555636 RepID=A0AAU6PBM2_9NEOP
MTVKQITVIVSVALLASCVQNTNGLPRDSSVLKSEDISRNEDVISDLPKIADVASDITPAPKISGRVWCQYEEATEDPVCQELCLPKRYSYGLCVGHTCSCI